MRNLVRILMGLFLVFAGNAHLSFQRTEFLAEVPPWIPMNPDLVVVLSGIIEILLGVLLVIQKKHQVQMGWTVAAFFVLVFPGNIAQLTEHRNAFGLNSDLKRWLRLPFQPVLIMVTLWSTGAWQKWRARKSGRLPG